MFQYNIILTINKTLRVTRNLATALDHSKTIKLVNPKDQLRGNSL